MRIGSENQIKINKKVTEAILAILFSKRNAAFSEFDNTKYIHPKMTITETCKMFDIIEIYEFAITNKPIKPINQCVYPVKISSVGNSIC